MYSAGVGLTDKCQLTCRFCYSKPHGNLFLNINQFYRFLKIFDVSALNFGTGESIFHPDFVNVIETVHPNRKLSVTSNGLTIDKLSDQHLKLFHDIDFSLDFPTETQHNQIRGGNVYNLVLNGLNRCNKLGIPASVVTVVMQQNIYLLPQILDIARRFGASYRLNLYKNSNNFPVAPLNSDFWKGIQQLLEKATLVACSEPVLASHPDINTKCEKMLCGIKSFRIKPDGSISACPYGKEKNLTLDNVINQPELLNNWLQKNTHCNIIPDKCKNCKQLNNCNGGCISRRVINQTAGMPDEYCFYNLPQIPKLTVKKQISDYYVHSGYLCTVILK